VTGGVRAALSVGAVVMLPTVAGLVLVGWLINKVGDALESAQDGLELAVIEELNSWCVD
jgi:hypothetical protein